VTITRAKRWSKHRLADVVVLLNGLAMIMQLIVDLTPTPSLTGIWPSSLELSIFRGILVILSMATWMATSALILGFWLDVLRRRMKVQLRPCTRILCLVGAALLLAVVPGIILLYVFANLTGDVFRTVGSVLLVLPFVLNTAVMVVVAALVTVRLRARLLLMNAGTKRRSLHARGWIWTLTAAWILYLLTIVFVLAAATLSSPVTTFAYEAILLVCRACVILSILMLADGHRRCNNCHFDTSISVSMATTPRTPSTVRNSSASSSSSTA
jgi:hypothetical protein